MKRTQIQLPDWLFAAAREVADQQEISLAELVRRGLEYMVAVAPGQRDRKSAWELPAAHMLGSRDPFSAPDWREKLHTERLRVAEEGGTYGAGNGE